MSPASGGCSTTRRSRSRSAPAPGTRTTTFPRSNSRSPLPRWSIRSAAPAAALLRGDASDPKLIETNTSTEYWQKGASLLHTDPLGTQDVALPPNVRGYLLAGTQHGGKAGMPRDKGPCVNPRNWHDPMPAIRALLVALDEWVVTDRAAAGQPVASHCRRNAGAGGRRCAAGGARPDPAARGERRGAADGLDAAAGAAAHLARAGAAGGCGRQRTRRHPAAGHRRAARHVHRLEPLCGTLSRGRTR